MRKRRRTTLVLLFAGAALPALAQGCGPTRLKVIESVMLDVAPEKAWATFANFQDVTWNAEVASSQGAGGNEPEQAVRTLALRNGTIIGESLYKYDAAAMSYAYHLDRVDVAKLPVQNASATLEVLPAPGGAKSMVRWKYVFYRNLAPGEGSPDEADGRAVEAVRRFMQGGLARLAKADPRT